MNKEAIERTKARCRKAQCNRVKHGDWDYLGWPHAKSCALWTCEPISDIDILKARYDFTPKPIFVPVEIKSHESATPNLWLPENNIEAAIAIVMVSVMVVIFLVIAL